ncbi:putative ribonuclease H-like domain-containing protein [Tanacetum coccineum]
MNGDEPVQTTKDENGVETEVPPKTAQAILARQKERKAKNILLLAIPNEYQLRFHTIKDAKSLWAAIKKGLDKAYDRFQKLISLLEVHGATVPNEDANQKFLRALPSSWNNVALIMRNKDGIDDLDIDDLNNNIKVFEVDIKVLNSQNMAFLSIEDTSSSNEVNTANSVSLHFRRTVPVETSDALVVQDNALIVQDGLGYDWSYIAQDEPTEFALMAYTSNSSGSDTEVQSCFDKLGLESVEAQLIVHQKKEVVYEEKIAVLEFEVKDKGNTVTRLTNQLEQTLKEKEDLKAKLEQFETSSKNLNKLINSQISSKDKTGLGYGDQLNENDSMYEFPPPLTRNYMPPLADLSFVGLDDFVYRPTANKTSTSVSQVETSITPPSNTSAEMPRVEFVRPSGVIIEEWVSDDDEDIFQSNEDPQTTVKPSFKNIEVSKEKVNTVRVNGVNTAGQTAVSTVKGNGVTAVKASAGCVWRPKMTDLNNGSKDNSGSWISKRGNPQQALKYKGMFDSGCSRHMTGNKALLTDYQDIDGGFVAFGGSTRGGKITGIKREYSIARTRQQNGVVERKNRTLIEAARNMLADSLLATVFWAEAVNTACYALDRLMMMLEKYVYKYQQRVMIKALKEMSYKDDGSRERLQSNQMLLEKSLKKELLQEKITRATSTNSFNTVSTPVNTISASRTFSPVGPSSGPSFVSFGGSFPIDVANLPHDPLMPELEDTAEIQSTGIFGNAYDDHDLETLNTPYADQSVGAEADFNNMEPSTVVSPIPTTRVHSIHPKAQIIGDPKSALQTRGKTKKNSGEHAMISYI